VENSGPNKSNAVVYIATAALGWFMY